MTNAFDRLAAAFREREAAGDPVTLRDMGYPKRTPDTPPPTRPDPSLVHCPRCGSSNTLLLERPARTFQCQLCLTVFPHTLEAT